MGSYADYKPPAWKGTCWVCGVPSSGLLIKVGTAEGGREVHSTCLGAYLELTKPIPAPTFTAENADKLAFNLEMDVFNWGRNRETGLRPDELPLDEPLDMNLVGPSLDEPEPESPAPRDVKKRKMLLDD